MEFIILVISGLSLFLIVMSNFKVSRVEEVLKEQKNVQNSIVDMLNSVASVQKKILDIAEQNDGGKESEMPYGTESAISVRNELSNIDRKIGAIHGMLRKIESRENSIETNNSALFAVDTGMNKNISEKKHNSADASKQKKELAAPDLKNVAVDIDEDRNSEIKFNRFIIKYNNITEDEKFVLNRILGNTPGVWEKIELDFMKDTTLKFILPMLCRKFIIDGVPLLKMKEIGGSFKVIWGESYPDVLARRIVDYFKDVVR